MSIATEISRIQADKAAIRSKLIELGMATNTDNLDSLANAISGLINRGAVAIEVKEGETYTIPAGYHNGSGTVAGVSGGGNYTLQSKSVTPTKSQQAVSSDEGYYGLSSVTVNPIPDAYQDVTTVTATAGEVLIGKIIVAADGTIVTGTMPNNGKVTKALSTTSTSYTIPKGYHDGTGTVTISLETKTVTPTEETQTINPTSGKVLSKVTVNPIPAKYIDTSSATAKAENVLDGMTVALPVKNANGAVTGAEIVEGTMPNNGAVSEELTISNNTYYVPEGYHNGDGMISVFSIGRTVTPTKEEQLVKSDDAFLTRVTVNPIPNEYQDVTKVTATADKVLTGSDFVNAAGAVVSGTMPNNGAVSKTLNTTTTSYTVPAGYHNGSGKVSITTETKSVTPTKSAQDITPTSGKVLSKVSVAAIPAKYQDVTSVDAVAGEVLSGKKIVSASGEVVTGTMPNNGATSETIDGLTKTSVTIPAGYTSGGTVSLTDDIEEALTAI